MARLHWISGTTPDFASMTPTHTASRFSEIMTSLESWAHTLTPVGTEAFDRVALFSLACYLVFAVIALHYALKTWAEKVMWICIAGGTVASLWLHLSIRHTPAYVGEGPLWKFASLSQYLPWAVISVGCVYLLYRLCARMLPRRS